MVGHNLLEIVLALFVGAIELNRVKAVVKLVGTQRHNILGGTLYLDLDVLLILGIVGNSHAFSIRREWNRGK
jgi:hypothetical protein